MSTFKDREKDFESRFQHDQELQFKATARRNKLLGLWAAAELGFSETEAEVYAKEVVLADFDEPGDDDVLRKVLGDFEKGGVAIDSSKIRYEMDRLMPLAKQEIMDE